MHPVRLLVAMALATAAVASPALAQGSQPGGAVVGGDPGTLISVGGAVVFLWGLYQYLN